jgi:hypothetical protein
MAVVLDTDHLSVLQWREEPTCHPSLWPDMKSFHRTSPPLDATTARRCNAGTFSDRNVLPGHFFGRLGSGGVRHLQLLL